MNITFYNQDITFNLKNKTGIKKWILHSIKSENKVPGTICFVFCSDPYLLELNKTHLNHATFTDIITFDYSAETKNISGDIFISIDRVKENAKKFEVAFEDELKRVMIHGVLHILGYKDKTPQQKKKMTLMENKYLSIEVVKR